MSKAAAPNPSRFRTGEAFENAYVAWFLANDEDNLPLAQETAIELWHDHCELLEMVDECEDY